MHHERRPILAVALTTLAFSATCGEIPEDSTATAPVQLAATGDPPAIDFTPKPSYLDSNVLVLTFDDGPDLANTPKVLDVLKQKGGIKATFFINSVNQTDLGKDQPAKEIVRRIVSEGHELANHSVHHPHLPKLTDVQIEAEITGVQKAVNDILGAGAPRLTLFRAPYGEPYTDSGINNNVARIVAKHAVHVGWAIDTLDWECPVGNADCVYGRFTGAVKTPGTGAYGVVLMHSIWAQTAGALPRILDYVKEKGFVLKLTEDVVRAKYGKTSGELIFGAMGTGGTGGGGAGGSGAGAGGADGGAGGADGGVIADGSAGGSAGGADAAGQPDPGAGGSGGSGPTVKPDAGSSKGGSGGSGGSKGTGGDEGGPDDTGSTGKRAESGGCSYAAGGTQAAPLLVLAAMGLALRACRRRRS